MVASDVTWCQHIAAYNYTARLSIYDTRDNDYHGGQLFTRRMKDIFGASLSSLKFVLVVVFMGRYIKLYVFPFILRFLLPPDQMR